MTAQQGEIYNIGGSFWIVVDHFYTLSERFPFLHCAPLLKTEDVHLELDVPISFQHTLPSMSPVETLISPPVVKQESSQQMVASMSLIKSFEKASLSEPRATARPTEVEQIRRNLVTRFSYYAFIDLSPSAYEPSESEQDIPVRPGMVVAYEDQRVCVIDHVGCFNDYPLLYVAPVVPGANDPTRLDVDISTQFQDLFSDKYFVRPGDFFLVESDKLRQNINKRTLLLTYGLVHKISRSMALKFGQLGLLL